MFHFPVHLIWIMEASVGLFRMKSYTVCSCSFFSVNKVRCFRVQYIKFGSILCFAGFDSIGHKYDSNGSLNNWWQNETTTNFQTKVQCFIDQVIFHIEVSLTKKKRRKNNKNFIHFYFHQYSSFRDPILYFGVSFFSSKLMICFLAYFRIEAQIEIIFLGRWPSYFERKYCW